MTEFLLLSLAFFFVLANGFFVAAEFAIVKVRSTQLEEVQGKTGRRGAAAQHVVLHLDSYLSATQLGITLASLALGWIGEPAFARILEGPMHAVGITSEAVRHGISFAVAFSILTILHIVLGELVPKSLAIRRPLQTTLWTAIPLRIFMKSAYPAIWILNGAANKLLSLIGIAPASESGEAHSEEEIRILLEESTEHGTIAKESHELLDGFFEFSRRTSRQIMIPRMDVVFLSTTRTIEENLATVRRARHTRFPLCDGDLDHTIGMLHVKDLFFRRQASEIRDLREIQREILYVPESLPAERLMSDMRTRRIHMAVVVDEYGGAAGVVTMENVLEELVGQIDDEFDRERPEVEKLPDGSWRIRGDLLLVDVAQRLDSDLPEAEAETLGGLVLEKLARKPKVGDRIDLGGFSATVEEARDFRVKWVRVRREEGGEE